MTPHTCCDGECNHDDCCGKVPENCPEHTTPTDDLVEVQEHVDARKKEIDENLQRTIHPPFMTKTQPFMSFCTASCAVRSNTMTTLHTTREVGEAIQKALPSFEIKSKWYEDEDGDVYARHEAKNWDVDEEIGPAPTLHETLIAIRELGKVRGWNKLDSMGPEFIQSNDEVYCSSSENYDCSHASYLCYLLLKTLITADLDLSHPSVSEYLIQIFSD